MWGQLISAGISAGTSLLGGFLGRKDEKRRERAALAQRNWESDREDTQIQRMVADAKKAGINPLTAIRAGQSSGYAQTHMPTLGRSAIANALGNVGVGIGQAFQAAYDYEPVNKERAHLELEIRRATLRNMNADTARMLSTDRTATGPVITQHGPTVGARANPAPEGVNQIIDERFRSTQDWEDSYYEMGGLYGALLNMGADWNANRANRGFRPDNYTVPTTVGQNVADAIRYDFGAYARRNQHQYAAGGW